MFNTPHVYKMKFYNRQKEIELLKHFVTAEGVTFIIIKGLRRVGKTRLIQETLKEQNYVNLFIPKDKTVSLFLEEVSEELKIPRFTRIIDLLRYISDKHPIIFIDEFQNCYQMDKSIYSDFQKWYEELKQQHKKQLIIVTGSSYSLISKIFCDYAKALYGRKDLEITLGELSPLVVIDILNDLGIRELEQQIMFWSVFGGMPKFYELIEKLPEKSFNKVMEIWFSQLQSLIDEGNSILISEFGGEYKIYYSLMEAVAQSKTKLSEISSVFNNDKHATNRYLDIVRNEYHFITKLTPLIDGLKSRRGVYVIKNNFIKFWFAFVKKYESYYEQGRHEELFNLFKSKINAFIGRQFEEFCLELIKNKDLIPQHFEIVGKQWGSMAKSPENKNQYEIDILALNEKTKEILFGECKWQDKVDAREIITRLKEKSKYIKWHNDIRKEYFILFAKSFIKKFKEENIYLFDLKEIEHLLKKT